MRYLVFAVILVSSATFASDPASSSYRMTKAGLSDAELRAMDEIRFNNDRARIAIADVDDDALSDAAIDGANAERRLKDLQSENCRKPIGSDAPAWTFFRFCKSDSVFGGAALAQNGETNTATFNAVNYHLWLGGKIKIPFQLLISATEDPGTDTEAIEDKNEAAILDAENGYAIRLPIYGVYNPQSGFCAFGLAQVGTCMAGGDITLSMKEFTDLDGSSKNAFSATARAGVSALFPIFEEYSVTRNGYLAVDAKIAYAYTNHSYNLQLFAPVTDAAGNPVEFKKQIAYSELGVKFAIDGRLSIAARWMTPFTGKEYLSDRTSVVVEMQF